MNTKWLVCVVHSLVLLVLGLAGGAVSFWLAFPAGRGFEIALFVIGALMVAVAVWPAIAYFGKLNMPSARLSRFNAWVGAIMVVAGVVYYLATTPGELTHTSLWLQIIGGVLLVLMVVFYISEKILQAEGHYQTPEKIVQI